MNSAIEVSNLSFRYAGAELWALQDVSFSIGEGEFVVFAGATGCGKSTLFKCLVGLIPQMYSGEYSGRVLVKGLDPSKTPVSKMAQRVGLVFQNPDSQLFALTVENDVTFALENLGLEKSEIERRVSKAFKIMGIDDLRNRSPFELSGGQKQRVAIASILALEPEILILDEPTSSLDGLTAKKLLEELAEIRRRERITVLVSEHRLDLVVRDATRLIVMDEGRILADGEPREVVCKMLKEHYEKLELPKLSRLAWALKLCDGWSAPLTREEFIARLLGGRR
ncbi:MAG: ABC transporter ATP-binding protein [Nitrososphaerota archaeon]|nr:energy-coupling factor ABC transporter ATP-binding protein [Candidatus Calditenuaceae archaeon]MDW8072758.1 ABC transporter ATP-binding protein [Nitrososphaerota archaeon]